MPLTIRPPRRPSTAETPTGDFPNSHHSPERRGVSPVRPPASPISPDLSSKPFQQYVVAKADLRDEPAPQPFSSEDSTDAIALRAAISSLQFQKKKAEDDIKTLRQIRDDALVRPDEFQSHIVEMATRKGKPAKFDIDSSEDQADQNDYMTTTFPPIPEPQEVVRMPPVDWEKYHVVGEPLDRMHNVQRQQKPIAAPYDPATDALGQSNGLRDSRKDSGASAGPHGSDPRPLVPKMTSIR